MQIVYDETALAEYMRSAIAVSPEHPVLIDKYVEDAIEVDVDAISDGEITVIGGIMEHIEEAGIHSGDSDCVLPPYTLAEEQIDAIKEYTYALAKALNVRGLMNIQYAVKSDQIYVLEVNPRASRTIPFVSKAIGIPLAKLAARIMVGQTLAITNSDPLLHNIKAVPTENRLFNISQPRAGMTSNRTFTAPEIMVPFECSVHGWMNAYAGVVEHPYFAVSGADGSFTIGGLPAGTYQVEAWHETLGTQSGDVTVEADGSATLNFTFGG